MKYQVTLAVMLFFILILANESVAQETMSNTGDSSKVRLTVDLCERIIISGGPIHIKVTCTNLSKDSLSLVHPTTLWNNVAFSIYNDRGNRIAKTYPDMGSYEMPVNYAIEVEPGKTLIMYDNLARLIKGSLEPGEYEIRATYSIPLRVNASLRGPIVADSVYIVVRASSAADKIVRKLFDQSWTSNLKTNEQVLGKLLIIAETREYKGVHAPYIKYHAGRILYILDRFDEALPILKAFTDEQKENKYNYIMGATLIANVYIQFHDYKKAAEYWESMPPTPDSISIAETLRSKAR